MIPTQSDGNFRNGRTKLEKCIKVFADEFDLQAVIHSPAFAGPIYPFAAGVSQCNRCSEPSIERHRWVELYFFQWEIVMQLDHSTPVFHGRFSATAPASQTPPADLLDPCRPKARMHRQRALFASAQYRGAQSPGMFYQKASLVIRLNRCCCAGLSSKCGSRWPKWILC